MLVDLLYYLCYFGEEEEEYFILLPCVLSSRVCVCVCVLAKAQALLSSISLQYHVNLLVGESSR